MIYILKVVLGALILSVSQIKRHPVVATCIIVLMIAGAHSTGRASASAGRALSLTQEVQVLQGQVRILQAHVARLDRACIPRATGGGVTQCLQKTYDEIGLRACLLNNAYVGVTQEDTRHLLVQCLDDFRDAHPGIHP